MGLIWLDTLATELFYIYMVSNWFLAPGYRIILTFLWLKFVSRPGYKTILKFLGVKIGLKFLATVLYYNFVWVDIGLMFLVTEYF
jgi:hypothetical protein